MATIEELSSALIKADAAGNAEDAKAFADAIRQMQSAAPAAPSDIPSRSALTTALMAPIAPFAGLSSGVANVVLGGQRLLGKGLSALGAADTGTFLQADAARRLAESQATVAPFKQEYPMLTGTGELISEVGATFPLGGALAAPLRLIPRAAPLAQAIQTGGFSTGRNLQGATGVARAGDVGVRAAGGAALGGTTAAVINPEDAEVGALTGAGVGVFAPGAVNLLAKGMGKLADIRQMPNQLAATIARESLGSPEQIAAARAAMQQAEGLGLTAQQALARAGVISPSAQATLEKVIKQSSFPGARPAVDTRAAIEAAQESARKSTIQGITPDLTEAINARRAASKPFYQAADRAVVPIDEELSSVILRMPKGTLSQAANIAKIDGRPFILGKTTPTKMVETGILDAAGNPVMREVPGETAEITGESLHYIKRALSDIAYGAPTTQVGRDTQLAARSLLGEYTKVFETKVPDYGQARQIFSDLSAPVNQAQVLKEMLSVLEKPGGGERIGPFLNALGRGEQAMLKRAGGRGAPRFESLSEVLSSEQLAKVREITKQLETQSAIGQQISPGQQRASDLIKDELANHRIPNTLNTYATIANRVLDTVGLKVGRKTIEKLAESALSSNSFDELLATLPASERNKVLEAISNPSTWSKVGGAITRAVAVPEAPNNALAPANQNAMAETQ